MKFLLALTLLTSVAFANEAKKEEHKTEAVKTEKVEGAKTAIAPEANEAKKEAYKVAKGACLAENKDLKGKELKDCIVSKNK